MDEVPHRSVPLLLLRVERQIQVAVVRQIQVERQSRDALPVRRVRQHRLAPSACASDASDAARQGTAPELKARPVSAADNCQDRSLGGDRRLACRAEFLRRVQDSPFQLPSRLAAK